ncbi:hypothetical protein D9M72_286990 [compost metagenome]
MCPSTARSFTSSASGKAASSSLARVNTRPGSRDSARSNSSSRRVSARARPSSQAWPIALSKATAGEAMPTSGSGGARRRSTVCTRATTSRGEKGLQT